MRAVRFSVSPEVVRQALHLPDTAEIVWASARFVFGSQVEICLTVSDPSIPESDEPYDTTPTITRTAPVEESFRWDWGVE